MASGAVSSGALRKLRMMQQNKLQRMQIADDNLGETASTQWKRIPSMSVLIRHMIHYAGATESSRGRPLYADMALMSSSCGIAAGTIRAGVTEEKRSTRCFGPGSTGSCGSCFIAVEALEEALSSAERFFFEYLFRLSSTQYSL